jgi:uncharacterized membrane protein YgaE (UPF0421/DUF939 family)
LQADAASVWRSFQRVGLPTQALKSALAAGLAWVLGAYVPWGPAQPYLAPLSAILTIQATVAESLQGALQRVLGAAVGVGVAALASHVVGVSPLTVVLLVVVSQAVGSVLRLTLVGTSQVVISALLVLTVGQATENGWLYGWGRIAETMVGASVGIVVNGLVAPPSYADAASRAWQALADELSEQLRRLAGGLRDGLSPEAARDALEQARSLGERLEAARAALTQAERSLRFNYFARLQHRQVGRFREALDPLEHAAIQLRGIARSLSDLLIERGAGPARPPWLAPDVLGRPIGEVMVAAGAALEAFGQAVLDVDRAGAVRDATRHDTAAAASRSRALAAVSAVMGSLDPDDLIALGAILNDLDRMIGDLTRARLANAP